MPIHGEHPREPEACHYGEAGAIGETELLVRELLEDLPSCLTVYCGHRHDLNNRAPADILSEANGRGVS